MNPAHINNTTNDANNANNANSTQNEPALAPVHPVFSTGLMSAASIMLNFEQDMDVIRLLQKKKKPNTKKYGGSKFLIACPNILCVADSSALQRLGGTGGTREGFCCSAHKGGCGERWSQRIYKCDEKTPVIGSDDPMIRPCTKLSYREKRDGVWKRSRRIAAVASGVMLNDLTFNGFTVQKDEHVDITQFNRHLARVVTPSQPGVGMVPVCMIALTKGKCPRHPDCVKNNGHIGQCRFM
jgi:hypothetical protein